MSERTPQDVLRELLGAVAGLPGTDVTGRAREAGVGGLVSRKAVEGLIEGALDKAIAEAPDSPPAFHRFASINPDETCPVDSFPAWAHDPAQAVMHEWKVAPDTLSEKPGLDVERLIRAFEEVQPGIYGRDFPNDDPREFQFINPRKHAEAIAAAYKRSWRSTDSEGR